jgi:hypothetical protein
MSPQTVDQIRWDARIKEKEHMLTFLLATVHANPDISTAALIQHTVHHYHPDDDIDQRLIDQIDHLDGEEP